ncbi:hypothetical protein [Peterkaempfera griseoplana]|uniref:hypothetical protein n=1 Tax=Peterkaempfera griseoplana TaxID=66896 RepID=UPI0006E21205|nr:hypothetical protein [Peterkaempfera griseoplana]
MDTTTRSTGTALLGIYLNDHLAGASGGVELARRLARQHRDAPSGAALRRLATEVAEDRSVLLELLRTLNLPVRRYKIMLGWAGEKVARLKLNGRVARRSPLSTYLELEAMALGIQGKLLAWRALRTWAEGDLRIASHRLEALEQRGQGQWQLLEDLRRQAAARVFPSAAG